MAKEKQITVIIGEEISPEEQKKIDPAKMGASVSARADVPEGDVTGQRHHHHHGGGYYMGGYGGGYNRTAQCPYCYAYCSLNGSYSSYICWNCGGSFRVY